MNTTIFKANDIRGVYPTDIDEKTVYAIGEAVARILPEGHIVVAHDVRLSSPALFEEIIKGIEGEALKLGKKVTLEKVGLSTTPMFYFCVNHFNAVGGAMITASHNPKEYNGVKIVREKALPISGEEIKKFVTF